MCSTVCDPTDCSLPSIHWIFQARVMEWVAISFSRGSSPPRDGTRASRTRAEALLSEPPQKPPVPAKELGLRILYRVSTQSVTTSSLQTCGRYDFQILLSLLGPQVVPAPTEEAGDGHSAPITTVERRAWASVVPGGQRVPSRTPLDLPFLDPANVVRKDTGSQPKLHWWSQAATLSSHCAPCTWHVAPPRGLES